MGEKRLERQMTEVEKAYTAWTKREVYEKGIRKAQFILQCHDMEKLVKLDTSLRKGYIYEWQYQERVILSAMNILFKQLGEMFGSKRDTEMFDVQ